MDILDQYQEEKHELIFDRFECISLEDAYHPPKPYDWNNDSEKSSKSMKYDLNKEND